MQVNEFKSRNPGADQYALSISVVVQDEDSLLDTMTKIKGALMEWRADSPQQRAMVMLVVSAAENIHDLVENGMQALVNSDLELAPHLEGVAIQFSALNMDGAACRKSSLR